MTDSEDHPSKEPKDSSALPEEYSEALTRLRNSLVHQTSFAASESFIKALSGIRESNESRQRAFQKALESFQPSYAPFRLRAEISALEEKAHKQADEISKHTADKKKAAQEIDKLRGIIEELNNKQGIQHLLSSVSSDVHEKIESDEEFRLQFTRETLENQASLRENGPVITGQDWIDGRQAARLL